MKPDKFLQNHSGMSPSEKLSSLVQVLTGPDGCSWDQRQTALSVIDHVIDEAHELKSALLKKEQEAIVSEFGDLLFTVEFLSRTLTEIAPEEAAARTLVEKMIRRHPHVFADVTFHDEAELKRNWEAEKRKETASRQRFDQDLPASLPPLERTRKVLARASNSGFRYLRPEDAWDKVWEELFELEGAENLEDFESELGDIMLALLTLARMKEANASNALTGATGRLCDRLEKAEKIAGRPLCEVPYDQIRGLYLKGKGSTGPRSAYFNYCGVSPWPREVRKGVHRAAQWICRDGLGAALGLKEERDELRRELAEFCGAPAGASAVLVPNVSQAALGVAWCFPWNPGDRLLLGRSEFPANTAPWLAAADTFGLQPLWWDEDRLRTEPERGYSELEALLAEQRPRLMALSAVSFWSGYRYALERVCEMCHRHGTKLYVDAIQALGAVPVSMGSLDYLAGGSHKTMLSPEGAGFLLVSPEAASGWIPRLYSWLSLVNPVEFLVSGLPDRIPSDAPPRAADPSTLEGSSSNALGYAGLREAVRLLRRKNPAEIFTRVQELQDELEDGLKELGWKSLRALDPGHRSSILSFDPPSGVDLVRFQQQLAERGVSSGIPNGRLRFGFHWPNTHEEVCYTLECCRQVQNQEIVSRDRSIFEE